MKKLSNTEAELKKVLLIKKARVYSCLTNRNRYVRINNKKSNFQKIISDVPQGSIAEPILFSFSINDLFFFVSSALIFNFTDDNSLSVIGKTFVEFKTLYSLIWKLLSIGSRAIKR